MGFNLRFFRNCFRLRIHCWGGLGSQLFAWAVVEELLLRNYSREIELVLHTSGVTKRISELESLGKYVKVTQIHDFKISQKSLTRFEKFQVGGLLVDLLRRFSRLILSSTRVISEYDNSGFPHPWTLMLRGHYSGRPISQDTLISMYQRLSSEGLINQTSKSGLNPLGIHYRLGDLLVLEEKTYIQPQEVVRAINQVGGTGNSVIDVYSDSPHEAVELLSKCTDLHKFSEKNLTPWDTISELLSYRFFISTNSKIGIWVALFRTLNQDDVASLIPNQLSRDVLRILGDRHKSSGITFY